MKNLFFTFAIIFMGIFLGVQSAQAGNDKGKKTYDTACFVCHATGVANAPKFGDKDAWAPRIKKGMDTLTEHALKGFQGDKGTMPAKGGRTDLSDEDVIAAVAYMTSKSQ